MCQLGSSRLRLNVLKALFPHARYYHDHSNPLHIRKQHVFPTYILTWLLKITLQHEHDNMISHEMITTFCNHLLRYSLASYHIWQKGHCVGICQIMIDSIVVSKNIGQVFGMPLHWKLRVVMTAILPPPRLSLWWQLAGTTVMTKLALRQFSILCFTHGLVNSRITIAIHCYSQRFLESESISCDKWLTSVWIVC